MNIQNFLEYHRSSDQPTHGSLDPRGKYSITNEEKRTFYNAYHNSLSQGQKLSITELQTSSYIPFLIDIDLQAEMVDDFDSENKSLYDIDEVNSLISGIMTVLQEISEEPIPLDHLTCFLFERDGYIMEKKNKRIFKNGIHLFFPKLIMNRQQIKLIVIPKIIEFLRNDHTMIPGDDYDTLFDTGIYEGKGKPWFLYGSTKPIENLQPYTITSAYYFKEGTIFIDKKWEKYLYDYETKYTSHENDKKSLQKCLPEIFSIQVDDDIIDKYYFEIDSTLLVTQEEDKMENLIDHVPFSEEDKDYDFFDKLLALVPDQYTEEYNSWIQIGFIIYNYFEGSLDGFHRWENHSKRCIEKYNYNECERLWNSMTKRDKGLNIGTLRYIVKKNRPLEYNELCKDTFQKSHVDLASIQSHFDLAKILHQEFQDSFVCSNIKHNDWYQFKNHIWEKNDDGIFLRQKISTFLVDKYQNLIRELTRQEMGKKSKEMKTIHQEIENYQKKITLYIEILQTEQREKEKKKIEKEIQSSEDYIAELHAKLDSMEDVNSKQKKKSNNEQKVEEILKLINQLKSSPFKKNIMKECQELFYDPMFEQKLNQSVFKIAFHNGVYDLTNHIFREGFPSDYISLKMPVNYRTDLSIDSHEVNQVKHFFEKVFTDKPTRDYFLYLQSEIFVGRNLRKLFQIWIGVGDNSKSVTQEIFERLLGPYCTKLPTSLLTQKRTGSSNASPELVRSGFGCRLCFIQEPDKTDKFNIGVMKELSGNDAFYARPLHRDPIDVKPMFKLICIANHAPKIENSQNDQAVWNRVRIIPFTSKFVKDSEVPSTIEEQYEQRKFAKDPNFSDKIDGMLEAFAVYLMHIYRTKPDVVEEPLSVLQATEQFRNTCDNILKFINDRIDETKVESSVSLERFMTSFRCYSETAIGSKKIPEQEEVKDYLIKRWGFPSDGDKVWIGKAFKGEDTL